MAYCGETKQFECRSGKVYLFPKTHCVFCKHCTNMFYDYTNGPYIFICEFGLEPDITETECMCEKFEDNGYVFDDVEYETRTKTVAEFRRRIYDNEDFKEIMHELAKKMLFGNLERTGLSDENVKAIFEMKGE